MNAKVKRYYFGVKNSAVLRLLIMCITISKKVKRLIQDEFGWRDYGGKHYESIWTRFYQGYILPEKFKIDKRKAHLSDLIFSGQITKHEALAEMQQPIYNETQLKEDYDFV
ncbi:MAG: hypothetical protein IPH56_02465 [Chitinophagaceae bacterium]|nr:hypothetical protein [Chitinophagaceae bacterium]